MSVSEFCHAPQRSRKFPAPATRFGHAGIHNAQPRPFASKEEHGEGDTAMIGCSMSVDLALLPKGWHSLVSEMIEAVHRIAPDVVFERVEAHPRGWLVADYDHWRVPIPERHILSKVVGGYTTLSLHTCHLCGSRFAVTCDGLPLCEPCFSNPTA